MSYHTSGKVDEEARALPPVPLPDEDSGPFWEAAARHELIAQRCAACRRWRHPPRPMCPECNSFEQEWAPVSGHARVWSWIVAHPPLLPAFAERAPYNVVVVELEEGIRMVGNLVGVANDEIREGMSVRATFEDVPDGIALPQWEPVKE